MTEEDFKKKLLTFGDVPEEKRLQKALELLTHCDKDDGFCMVGMETLDNQYDLDIDVYIKNHFSERGQNRAFPIRSGIMMRRYV